jgi:hypothetical protein
MAKFNGVKGEWQSIEAEEVKQGDIVRVIGQWNGWGGVSRDVEVREDDTLERFVPEQPKPTVPTEPGLYRDVDGDLWYLTGYGDWQLAAGTDAFEEQDRNVAEDYLPFTKVEV